MVGASLQSRKIERIIWDLDATRLKKESHIHLSDISRSEEGTMC